MIEARELQQCSINHWYPLFSDIAMKTLIFEMDPQLLERLQEDGCNTDAESICPPEYVQLLKDGIKRFGNEAFVKNNWHAPVDAKFMSFGNALKVTNLNELILYLNASDIIVNDFSRKDVKFYIALRPWMNVHPASEFRCIVINKILSGIAPRDWLTFYPHFHYDGPRIIQAISNFFNQKIRNKFPLQNYVFDVIMRTENEIVLVDFGPLNSKTRLYTFKWSEVKRVIQKNRTEEVTPVFRFLETDVGIVTPALRETLRMG